MEGPDARSLGEEDLRTESGPIRDSARARALDSQGMRAWATPSTGGAP